MARKKNKTNKNLKQRNGLCSHLHTHTLVDSNIDVCSSCSLVYYCGGEVRKIESFEEVKQSINILQTYFNEIKRMGEKLNAKILYKDFDLEMMEFQNILTSLIERLKKANENGASFQYSEIKSDSFKLKSKFELSQSLAVVSRLKVQIQLMNKLNNGIEYDSESDEDTRAQDLILKAKEALSKKHEKDLIIIKEEAKIESDRLINQINEYKEKLQNSEENLKKLTEIYSKSLEDTKNLNLEFGNCKNLLKKSEKEIENLKEGNSF